MTIGKDGTYYHTDRYKKPKLFITQKKNSAVIVLRQMFEQKDLKLQTLKLHFIKNCGGSIPALRETVKHM